MNILTIYLCLLSLATYLGVAWTIMWYFDKDEDGTAQVAVCWPFILFVLVVVGLITLPVWSYYLLFTDEDIKYIF